MFENWSFGRKIAAGFAVTVLLTVLMGSFSIYTIRDVAKTKDDVIHVHQQALTSALRLDALVEAHIAANRGFLLTHQAHYLEQRDELERETAELLTSLRVTLSLEPQLLAKIERDVKSFQAVVREQDAVVHEGSTTAEVEAALERALPARQALRDTVEHLVMDREANVQKVNTLAGEQTRAAIAWVIGLSIACALLAILSAVTLTRVLGRQIGAAVNQMQSSSAELQAAAGQQASGLREQASAMTEVTTTISELLATSRQIAESARRVAQLANETAGGARQGTDAVKTAQESIGAISRQMDQVVTYMLELGRKSQRIGTVLDLVSELAEQTNILAINATIEATGAGDAGRRFLVVADEIRKLADRVGGSTKEVRTLVEEVRSAVNTTVMATETGAKAVESGSRRFEDLSQVFTQIVELVGSTTDAAREIELSTKQQASAVEQVNVAVASVAQTTREGEASSSQTLQTAAQLATLSRALVRVVQVGAAR